jgi:hypothetical protein
VIGFAVTLIQEPWIGVEEHVNACPVSRFGCRVMQSDEERKAAVDQLKHAVCF